jgi:CheY-like chemotaxis protein
LRNPLAPIRNAVHVLRLKEPHEPNLRWARDVIDRQAKQMTRLVDDLVDVSRITRGLVTLRFERVDLATVLHSAVESSRPLIDARKHTLAVKLPDEMLYLDADPARLSQVVLNLLNNAARYTEPGGHIELLAGRDGDDVWISVRDDGIGIEPENLPQLFELFAQVRKPGTDQTGLGVGLALVRQLVALHGGTVVAKSEGAGRGSEFTVRLPRARKDSAERTPGAIASESRRRRVLVVDDNRDAADSLAMLLRIRGHDAHVVYDSLQAEAEFDAFRPEVVLLDLGMPDLSGHEVAQRLRRKPQGREPLIVAVTGWGQDEDRRRSREAGFDLHMTKPVDPDDLLMLLARPLHAV